MMKFLGLALFMIPSLYLNNYWFNAFLMFFSSFLFLVSFSFDYNYLSSGFHMGLDQLSFLMVLLSYWICALMLLASNKVYSSNSKILFQLMIMSLFLSLFLAFCFYNFLLFYIFFEVSLIPTLFLIVGWGYQPERLQAGMYLFFYTMLASLPMLVSLFFLYKYLGTLIIFFFSELNSFIYFLFLTMVFFVKVPLFTLHLWLPKAHVEAPVSGSMILAGVMLKLGGYGLMRVLSMFIMLGVKISCFFVSISLFGGVLVSIICLRQSDMKSLIAYSSVAHMALLVAGLFTYTYWGFMGSLAVMIGHGLCSSGLFCLANINYERTSSRSLYINKGMINLLPSMSLCWFLLCSSNMAAPPSFNLLSEILLLSSVVYWNFIIMIILFFLSFFSAAYTLFLYSYVQHGSYYMGLFSFSCSFVREYILIILHWLPLNMMFMKSGYFCCWI